MQTRYVLVGCGTQDIYDLTMKPISLIDSKFSPPRRCYARYLSRIDFQMIQSVNMRLVFLLENMFWMSTICTWVHISRVFSQIGNLSEKMSRYYYYELFILLFWLSVSVWLGLLWKVPCVFDTILRSLVDNKITQKSLSWYRDQKTLFLTLCYYSKKRKKNVERHNM